MKKTIAVRRGPRVLKTGTVHVNPAHFLNIFPIVLKGKHMYKGSPGHKTIIFDDKGVLKQP